MTNTLPECLLCTPQYVVLENNLAFARHDDNALSPGHLLIIPRRHVASLFQDRGRSRTITVPQRVQDPIQAQGPGPGPAISRRC